MNDKPCVGSGFCCWKAACIEGQRANVGYNGGPCPSLRWTGKRHACGLILDANEAEAAKLKASLYIGAGCCAPMFNDCRKDLQDRTL